MLLRRPSKFSRESIALKLRMTLAKSFLSLPSFFHISFLLSLSLSFFLILHSGVDFLRAFFLSFSNTTFIVTSDLTFVIIFSCHCLWCTSGRLSGLTSGNQETSFPQHFLVHNPLGFCLFVSSPLPPFHGES